MRSSYLTVKVWHSIHYVYVFWCENELYYLSICSQLPKIHFIALYSLSNAHILKKWRFDHIFWEINFLITPLYFQRSRLPLYYNLQQNSMTGDPLQLDSMLGTLQKDMSKHGINTIPKGDCASCGKPIIGQVFSSF